MNHAKTKHSLKYAVLMVVFAPVLAVGVYLWAEDVQSGKQTVTRRRSRQGIADLFDGILSVIGPAGALCLGVLLILTAIGYLIYVINLQREVSPQTSLASGVESPSLISTLPASIAKKCPHCQTPLLGSEYAKPQCPSCGMSIR
jgi:hypothetical protein